MIILKKSIEETYGKRGEAVIKQNFLAVDSALENMYKVEIPDKVTSTIPMKPAVPPEAPEYVREVLGKIIDRDGDNVRVSEMPVDGTFPTATTQWEKRNVALEMRFGNRTCVSMRQVRFCVPACCHPYKGLPGFLPG